MRSFEDFKKEVKESLERELEFWKSDTQATPDFRERQIEQCQRGLDNIDEMVQQQIAFEAVDLVNMTGRGLLDTDRVRSVNRLFITPEDEEYRFLSSNPHNFAVNDIFKDEFLQMISKRYGFEIPSLQETNKLKGEVSSMRDELFEKYKYSKATSTEFKDYLQLEMLEAKLLSNEVAFGKYSQYKETQAEVKRRTTKQLEHTKEMINKMSIEEAKSSGGMTM